MSTLWQPESRRLLQTRIARLTEEHRPSWGRMSAPQMVSHLIESVRMATGDLPVARKSGPLRYPPLKQLVIYYLPWPKNAPTAPELLKRSPHEWDDDVKELAALLDRFTTRAVSGPWPEHPAFGPLSGDAWGFLVHRHVDHHLTQFGV